MFLFKYRTLFIRLFFTKFFSWIWICIEKNCWIRMRKKLMHIHSHVNVSKMFQHYSLVNNNGFAAVWHPFGAVVVEVVVWEIFFFQTIPNNLSLAKLEKIGIVNKKFSTETKNINFKLYTAGKKIKKAKGSYVSCNSPFACTCSPPHPIQNILLAHIFLRVQVLVCLL